MGSATTTGAGRGLVMGAVLVVGLVLFGLLVGSDSRVSGPPLSPRSDDDDGSRALVLLLESYHAVVHVGGSQPAADTTVAVLFVDRLDGPARAALRGWVEDGHTLVVLDPDSPLAAERVGASRSRPERGTCDLADIAATQLDVSTPVGLRLRGASRLAVGAADGSCFGDGASAFVVAHAMGAGRVVTVGGQQPFINARLVDADNGALAVGLLAPADGARISVLDSNAPGGGDQSVWDLIPDRVFQAMVQLVVAFVLYALWRARRLGRPVPEQQPVAIPASGLVRAVGRLRQRSRATDRAAEAVRADTRRLLAQRYGLGPAAPPDVVAEITAARTGLASGEVLRAIAGGAVPDEAALVALTRQIDTIRQEALDGRSG